jgi:hypothetical protein
MFRGTVKSGKRDSDGKPIGSLNPNPILDTRECLMCFEDGLMKTRFIPQSQAEGRNGQHADDGAWGWNGRTDQAHG